MPCDEPKKGAIHMRGFPTIDDGFASHGMQVHCTHQQPVCQSSLEKLTGIMFGLAQLCSQKYQKCVQMLIAMSPT